MADASAMEEEDVLELCALVEEYREALQNVEAENESLTSHIHALTAENERLKETTQQQSEVIQRLDDSVNQLMEELEHKNEVIATKENDLHSLQHCLNVIHKRKVEVDDQAQLEQGRVIEKLYAEKSKLSEAYSSNLKILEEYLDIINAKESEILDLKLVIQSYEGQLRTREGEEPEEEEGPQLSEQMRPPTTTASTVTSSSVGSTPLRAPQRVNPSPPTTAPPAGMRQAITSGNQSTTTSSATASAAALATIRATSTAVLERSHASQSDSTQGIGLHYHSDDDAQSEEHSPTQPVTINRSRVTKLSRHGSIGAVGLRSTDSSPGDARSQGSQTATAGTLAEQKAAALQKYRTLQTQSPTTDATTTVGSSTGAASASSGTSAAYIGSGPASGTTGDAGSTEPRRWSDVGKHERLFDPAISIIKDKSGSKAGATAQFYSKHSSHPAGQSANARGASSMALLSDEDAMHDSIEYEPDSPQTTPPLKGALHKTPLARAASYSSAQTSRQANHGTSSASVDDGIVEVFLHSDSSNPPSPERMKPNRPIYKPPFSKPVFNEFTGHPGREKNTSSGNSTREGNNKDNFSSKEKFDLYAGRKGALYEATAPDKESEDFDSFRGTGGGPEAKAVRWADSKGVDASPGRAVSGAGGKSGDLPRASSSSGGWQQQDAKRSSGSRESTGSGKGWATAQHRTEQAAPPPVKENSWLGWKSSSSGPAGGSADAGRKGTTGGGGSASYSRL